MTGYKKDPAIALLEKESQDLGFVMTGDLFVWLRNADEFIERCRSRRIAVIGWDGFEKVEGGIRPYIDMIVSLSHIFFKHATWQPIVVETCDQAHHFVNLIRTDKEFDRSGEMFALEFVLETEQEWIADRE